MASMPPSSKITLFVTHVEPEGRLLRIWGQRDRNAVTRLEEIIQRVEKRFELNFGVPNPGSNLPAGLICCAKFHDYRYRRAKVCGTQPDGAVLVRSIDYGNSEVLPLGSIRLLENVPNDISLQMLPPLAFECVPANVMAANGGWETETLESIRKAMCYTNGIGETYSIFKTPRLHKLGNTHVTGKIYSTFKTRRLVKLCYKNEDFGEFLVRENLAIRASVDEMFAMRMYVFQNRPPKYSFDRNNNEEELRWRNLKEVENEQTQRNDPGSGRGGGNRRMIDENTWRRVANVFKGKGRKRKQGTQGHQGKRQPTRRQRRRQETELRKMERRMRER